MKPVAKSLLTGMIALIALPALLVVSGSQAASAEDVPLTVKVMESGKVAWRVSNCDGRLEEFTTDLGDHVMYHRYQGTRGGGYTGWLSLGGKFIGNTVPGVRNIDCRLEVFGLGTNHAMYHKYQTRANAGPWSDGWLSLGGWLQDPPLGWGRSADGRAFVLGIGSNGLRYIDAQTRPAGGPWTGWVRF